MPAGHPFHLSYFGAVALTDPPGPHGEGCGRESTRAAAGCAECTSGCRAGLPVPPAARIAHSPVPVLTPTMHCLACALLGFICFCSLMKCLEYTLFFPNLVSTRRACLGGYGRGIRPACAPCRSRLPLSARVAQYRRSQPRCLPWRASRGSMTRVNASNPCRSVRMADIQLALTSCPAG